MEVMSQAAAQFERLGLHLDRLQAILIENNIDATQAADVSTRRFAAMTTEKQNKILANILTQSKILSQKPEIGPVTRDEKRQSEIARTKRALREFGLKAPNSDIFDLIDDGDIIEIYNFEGTQLYRNINFCKTCSYNILDLAVNPWEDLYEKPSTAISAIQDIVKTVLTDTNRTISFNLSSFIQKEKFAYASSLKTFLISLKYISPLDSALLNQRAGFISTCTAEIIAQGNESVKFSIL